MKPFQNQLAQVQEKIERVLDELLPLPQDHSRLMTAIRYSTLGGGKRLRPFLCALFSRHFSVPEAYSLRVGCAIEILHSYSLIHDDLPAMDDSPLRRGKPSCHIKFDEATAILAGDAMQTYAFEILSDPLTHPNAEIRCKLVQELAQACGSNGMALGQMMDVSLEGQSLDEATLSKLEELKTARLIEFSCLAPAIMAEQPGAHIELVTSIGRGIGILFQIVDDLLDQEGEAHDLGKPSSQDSQKTTFASLEGLEKGKEKARLLADELVEKVFLLGSNSETKILIDLIQYILNRKK